ncbi:MAG: hypothetical protein DYG92_02690 [Leptolyngbya sp. PLA1]|nr:hypothetical protein [Leptolyngbya sp. PLA1]
MNLRIHRDRTDSPEPSAGTPRNMRLRGYDEPRRADHTDAAAGAEDALNRMERQLRNLKELLGERFEGPDGPRAA